MSIEAQSITAQQLWDLPEMPGSRLELIEGKLTEVPGAGILHAAIVGFNYRMLPAHSQEQDIGLVLGDGAGYIVRRDPDTVRIPDVSVILRARLPENGLPEGFWNGPPDLAVEVVSPNDNANDVYAKVRDYLDAGAQLVWIVWPRSRSVMAMQAGGGARDYGPEDHLNGGDVLPGFSVAVMKIFEAAEPNRDE